MTWTEIQSIHLLQVFRKLQGTSSKDYDHVNNVNRTEHCSCGQNEQDQHTQSTVLHSIELRKVQSYMALSCVKYSLT